MISGGGLGCVPGDGMTDTHTGWGAYVEGMRSVTPLLGRGKVGIAYRASGLASE